MNCISCTAAARQGGQRGLLFRMLLSAIRSSWAAQWLLPFLTARKIKLLYVGISKVPLAYKELPNRISAMAIMRSALALLLTCCLAIVSAVPLFAMDVTIAPSAPSSVAGNKRKSPPKAQQKVSVSAGEKPRQRDKFRFPRITTYSLFNDPAYLRSDPLFSAERRLGTAGGVAGGRSGGTGMPVAGLQAAPGPMAGHQAEPADNTGIAFDCRKKPSLAAREVTACYVHKVDKAWKTQTYVTKGLADSNPGWGGGLAVGYAY